MIIENDPASLRTNSHTPQFLMGVARCVAVVLVIVGLHDSAGAQALGDLLQKSRCTLPVYFSVETVNVGRIFKEKNLIKVQVNNFETPARRDGFIADSSTPRNTLFSQMEPVHEFLTRGEQTFGGSLSDSYKGLEWSGKIYFFKYRGSGDELKKLKVSYRSIPPHGQVVIQEIGLLDYFNRILKTGIIPALNHCR